MATNGRRMSAAYRKPARTGPATMPSSKATALRAMSQGRRSGCTRSAGSDREAGALNARAMPKPSTRTKMGRVEEGWLPAYQPSPSAITAWTTPATATISRRSKRSATAPLTRTSSNAGANSASPSRPRSSSLPVRS